MFESLLSDNVVFSDDVFRNIPAIAVSQQLLAPLSSLKHDWDYGESLVEDTKKEDITGFESAIINRPFLYGVGAPGASTGFTRTRFSDGTQYGIWYGSLDMLTTLYETVYHFVQNILEESVGNGVIVRTERRIFAVGCDGILIDLRGKYKKFPGLVSNDYSYTHALGDYLYRQNINGALVKLCPSCRRNQYCCIS